jgi:hypothetical protein
VSLDTRAGQWDPVTTSTITMTKTVSEGGMALLLLQKENIQFATWQEYECVTDLQWWLAVSQCVNTHTAVNWYSELASVLMHSHNEYPTKGTTTLFL